MHVYGIIYQKNSYAIFHAFFYYSISIGFYEDKSITRNLRRLKVPNMTLLPNMRQADFDQTSHQSQLALVSTEATW